jgi:hypothetical protein
LLILFSFLAPIPCIAQYQNNIWCFGDSAGIDFSNSTNPVAIGTSLDTRGSCVSISDSVGQLLFYASTRADGGIYKTQVWNFQNQLIDNGDSIVGEGWYNELIILPIPGSSTKYYLFSLSVILNYGIFYSVIDMSENNGFGKVIQKNVLYQNYKPWDALAAVKHANGRDWWLITKDYDIGGGSGNALFHINLITPDTISEVTQNIGGREFGNLGNMSFSKDGSKFVFMSRNGLIEVMDFDRCLGQFSNVNVIINHTGTAPHYTGSAFSANSEVLYVSTNDLVSVVYQFDLNAVDIFGSKIIIGSISNPGIAGGTLRLAPDDKIYWACAWNDGAHFNYPYPDSAYYPSNMNLSVINNPDMIGSGCNLSLYSFYLGGKRTYWGLPNNPDYSLGPVIGSVCDSLSTGTINSLSKRNPFILSPNPMHDWLTIYQKEDFTNGRSYHATIFTSQGQLVYEKEMNTGDYSIPVSSLNVGVYFLQLKTISGVFTERVVKLN